LNTILIKYGIPWGRDQKITVTKKLLLFAGITAVALMFNALTAEPAKHAGPYVGVPKDRVELADRLPVEAARPLARL
jgi:hypothetical protein